MAESKYSNCNMNTVQCSPSLFLSPYLFLLLADGLDSSWILLWPDSSIDWRFIESSSSDFERIDENCIHLTTAHDNRHSQGFSLPPDYFCCCGCLYAYAKNYEEKEEDVKFFLHQNLVVASRWLRLINSPALYLWGWTHTVQASTYQTPARTNIAARTAYVRITKNHWRLSSLHSSNRIVRCLIICYSALQSWSCSVACSLNLFQNLSRPPNRMSTSHSFFFSNMILW